MVAASAAGGARGNGDTNMDTVDTDAVNLKEYMDMFLNGGDYQTPRFNLRTEHPVENFYKRHMTND